MKLTRQNIYYFIGMALAASAILFFMQTVFASDVSYQEKSDSYTPPRPLIAYGGYGSPYTYPSPSSYGSPSYGSPSYDTPYTTPSSGYGYPYPTPYTTPSSGGYGYPYPTPPSSSYGGSSGYGYPYPTPPSGGGSVGSDGSYDGDFSEGYATYNQGTPGQLTIYNPSGPNTQTNTFSVTGIYNPAGGGTVGTANTSSGQITVGYSPTLSAQYGYPVWVGSVPAASGNDNNSSYSSPYSTPASNSYGSPYGYPTPFTNYSTPASPGGSTGGFWQQETLCI